MLDYKKNKDRYTNKVEPPSISQFTTYNCYKNGQVVATNVNFATAIKHQKNGCAIEDVVDEKAYKKAYKKYRNGALEAEQRWKKDLEKEYKISLSDPVIKCIFEKAWDEGHSNGYQEIEYYFVEYLELVEYVLKNAKDSEFIKKILTRK